MCSIDSKINILIGASLDGGDDRLIRGVDNIKGLLFNRLDKLAIDEEILNDAGNFIHA